MNLSPAPTSSATSRYATLQETGRVSGARTGLVPWGAELLLRAGDAAVLGGAHRHTDVVVIRFPDRASSYRLAQLGRLSGPDTALRQEAADVDLVSYVGS